MLQESMQLMRSTRTHISVCLSKFTCYDKQNSASGLALDMAAHFQALPSANILICYCNRLHIHGVTH